MPISLSNRAVQVHKKELTTMEKLYLPAILGGMGVTISHFFKKKRTYQYPEVQRPRAVIWRGTHVLKRDEEGRERCTACGLCAVACPAEAITMICAERTKDETKTLSRGKICQGLRNQYAALYFLRFMQEACPKQAIYLTDRLTPANYNRNQFIYGKDILVEPVERDKRIDITKRTQKYEQKETN